MRSIMLLAALALCSCDDNHEGIHADNVCVNMDCAGRSQCFDHCVEYGEAGESEEGEDVIYACDGTCERLHCHCRKYARRCVDRLGRHRKCLPGMK